MLISGHRALAAALAPKSFSSVASCGGRFHFHQRRPTLLGGYEVADSWLADTAPRCCARRLHKDFQVVSLTLYFTRWRRITHTKKPVASRTSKLALNKTSIAY